MTVLARATPKPAFAFAVLACAACGMGLALWPLGTSGALLTALVLSFFIRGSRGVLKSFLVFLLIQDLLQVLAGGETPFGMAIKRADEPMIFIFGGLCLVLSNSVQNALRNRGILFAFAGCYAGVILSSLPPSSGVLPSLLDLALFSKPFFLFAIGLSIVPDDAEIERSIRPLLIVMLAVVSFGIVFLIAPQLQDTYIGSMRAPDERLGLLSAQGFFIGPGTYSWFAAVTFGLAYAAYLTYLRSFYLVSSLIAAGFVVLSWRRKSILAVLAILLISVIVRTSRATRSRAVAVVGLTAVIALAVLGPYATGLWNITMTEYGGSDPHENARSALYYTSILIARDHFPLGAGLASFGSHASKLYYSSVYSEYGISDVYGLSSRDANFITDTFWPMVAGEGGVVSLLGYLGFFWLLLSMSWRDARRVGQQAAGSFVALATLFVVVGSLIESTASHIYGSGLQAVLVMIPAGILWERDQRRAAVLKEASYPGALGERENVRTNAGA